MNKKILLIEPSYFDLYGKNRIALKQYFPLGLGYIASSLKSNGYDCRMLINYRESDYFRKLNAIIKEFEPLFIGFTSMTPNFPKAVEIAERIKQEFSIPIVIGGIHVTAFRSEVFRQTDVFDYVVYGEGEDTVVELADTLAHKKNDFSRITGLIWKNSANVLIENPPRKLESNLDRIPFPARELVNLDKYSTQSYIGGGRSATILTSRGCPHQCVFCASHTVSGYKYREHSVDYVISEIEELKNKYNMRYLFIQDNTFTLNKKRVENICEQLINRNINIKFGCFSRVDIIDHSMIKLLKKAGCINMFFGVESADEEVLLKLKKRISLSQAKEVILVCRKNGIRASASFVVGSPFDTKETIEKTIDAAIELNPDVLVFSPLVPFPGAEVFDNVKHLPKDLNGWNKFVVGKIPPYSLVEGLTPTEIYDLAQKGNRKFYLRPSSVWQIIRTIRNLSDIKEYFRLVLALFRRKE